LPNRAGAGSISFFLIVGAYAYVVRDSLLEGRGLGLRRILTDYSLCLFSLLANGTHCYPSHGDVEMERFFARPVASNGDYESSSAANNDLEYKGQAALDLIRQAADAVTATEKRLEVSLLKVLDQLKSAEDRNGILTARATQAEGRASDAVKWLKRLHDEIKVQLAPRI